MKLSTTKSRSKHKLLRENPQSSSRTTWREGANNGREVPGNPKAMAGCGSQRQRALMAESTLPTVPDTELWNNQSPLQSYSRFIGDLTYRPVSLYLEVATHHNTFSNRKVYGALQVRSIRLNQRRFTDCMVWWFSENRISSNRGNILAPFWNLIWISKRHGNSTTGTTVSIVCVRKIQILLVGGTIRNPRLIHNWPTWFMCGSHNYWHNWYGLIVKWLSKIYLIHL